MNNCLKETLNSCRFLISEENIKLFEISKLNIDNISFDNFIEENIDIKNEIPMFKVEFLLKVYKNIDLETYQNTNKYFINKNMVGQNEF